MNLKDKNLSLQFYNKLCDIIGSPDVVKTRRDIFTLLEFVKDVDDFTFMSSGSKAEGLDLKGSDYDQMFSLNFVRVYEKLNDIKSVQDKMILVMDTTDTKPGFTKLKLLNKEYINRNQMYDWFEIAGKEIYISSKRFREHFLSHGMISHGPCQSSPDGIYDCALCFRCEEWITPAQYWIRRSRTRWPKYNLVSSVVQYGVLFVPVGCKNSPNEDLQWRISFSVTEKLLIHSFSHTQVLCYALLKIILKDIIKPRHGDLLCSYFLKTIMFWLSEEISPSEWKPENMISRLSDCIKRLHYCVEYKTCLHYFIPENNLFEDRFTNEEHNALVCTIGLVYRSPLTSVLDTATFKNYRLEMVNSHLMTLSASSLSCFPYICALYTPHSVYSVLKRLVNGYKYILQKEICAFMISVCFKECIHSTDFNNFTDRNTIFYKQYKRTLCNFNFQCDSISSWLLFASLFYKCKRFLECLDIINYCLFSCSPDKICLYMHNSFGDQTVFKTMMQKYGLSIAFKYLIVDNVVFRHPFCLLPDELKPLMTEDNSFFPPIVYSHLLHFLCFYHLGDHRGQHNALHDLETTISEEYFTLPCDSTLQIVNKSIDIFTSLI